VGDENEWIRTGRDGSNVISTVPLRQLLGKLADINPQSSQLKHIKSCLAFAEKIINLLSLSESSLKQRRAWELRRTLTELVEGLLWALGSIYRHEC